MTVDFSVRPAATADMDMILEIQAVAHPAFQEDQAVFAERLALYPQGFHVATLDDELCGYVISHPWRRPGPPAINALIGALPGNADIYYIHDLSLLPVARGLGLSDILIGKLKDHAKDEGFSTMALTAVGGSFVFWRRHGCVEVENAELISLLSTYGAGSVYMEAVL